MGTHDGGIDHGVFVVCILRQSLEQAGPHATLAPARVAQMHHPKVSEARGEITPGDAGAVAVKHRVHEQTVITGSDPDVANPSGQQVLDAFPLVISQRIPSFHGQSFIDAWPVPQDLVGMDDTRYRKDLAERALVHAIENKVEAAYHRTDLLEKRRLMMQSWADFLDPQVTANG